VSYDKYIAWRRLTNNGRRGRDEMSPESQAEYDSHGFQELSAPDFEEAKRAYEEVTRRSDPGSSSSS
jgi:hypothetical protein